MIRVLRNIHKKPYTAIYYMAGLGAALVLAGCSLTIWCLYDSGCLNAWVNRL